MRVLVLLALVLVSLPGCGESGDSGEAAARAPACPCLDDDAWLEMPDGHEIQRVPYMPALKTPRIVIITGEKEDRSFPHGLDALRAFESRVIEDTPWLYLAGCRGEHSVIRVFSDLDEGRYADDFVGEFVLPPDVRLDALAEHAIHGLLGFDRGARRIVRLPDEDGDHIPDDVMTWVRAPDSEYDFPWPAAMWSEGDDLVIIADSGCVLVETPFVVRDEDGDGAPEWAGPLPWQYHHSRGPEFHVAPAAGEESVQVRSPPETVIAAWLTDEDGVRLSEDKAVARLGFQETGSLGTLVELTRPLREGESIRLFDTKFGVAGPVARVGPPKPAPPK